jgi:hypothetical protein
VKIFQQIRTANPHIFFLLFSLLFLNAFYFANNRRPHRLFRLQRVQISLGLGYFAPLFEQVFGVVMSFLSRGDGRTHQLIINESC